MTALKQIEKPRLDAAKSAIIYCRVSSKKQTVDGAGLDSQEHRCREYANERGYVVKEVFPDSQTAKGDFMDRPGMKALLAYLDDNRHEPHIIIFDDLKRFARDTEFHWNLRRTLAERNAVPECLNFRFEESPEGRFIETIIAAQGQLEREQIGRQSVQKMRARLERGFAVFRAPVGYKYVKAKGGGKVLKIDPILGPIVKEALEGYASGRFASQTEVRRFLENQPDYPKDMTGGLIRPQTIPRLLSKEIYAGLVGAPNWGIPFRPGQHDPLVSMEIFQRIEERLNQRAFVPRRADNVVDFPLRGAVCCSSCGSPLTSGWCKGKTKRYPYHWCHNPLCDLKGKTIARDKMHEELSSVISEVTPAECLAPLFRAILRKRWEMQAERVQDAQKSIEKQIADNDTVVSQLVERTLGASSPALAAAFEKKIEEVERETLLLRSKQSKITRPKVSFDELFELSLRFFSMPKKLWESDVYELQRLVLKLVFKGHLPYARGQGFEHLPFSETFRLINTLGNKVSDKMTDFSSDCKMVPRGRIELPTSPLPRVRSTTELPRH
tara:strand:+ start:7563 stop:9221 length:1659 start_codon:yes stop_codon:yes gene_type:complete